MKLKLIKNIPKDKKLFFLIEGINPAFANTIRRTMINSVPTLAIEEVEFKDNASILYDDMVAHRLGLIPLTTDLKAYNIKSECRCKGAGCARCQIQITLKTKKTGTVYASELKCKDTSVKPVFPNTPIVKLLEGQNIELVATAELGRGKDHMKWSPGHVYYKYLPVLKINKQPTNAKEIVENCPKKIFKIKENKLSISQDKLFDCSLCGACMDLNKDVCVEEDPTRFVFCIESWGQLEPKDIFKQAIMYLSTEVDNFAKEIKKL